ncbi:guanine nucleotide-binding protein G(s) subunit alpha [Biomphalaria pfeifferi]|uniref:Guanine nucleotide-binding protein G(s) subunit alpha n=1 Tax=Biomphalaria pfeifferi TaxID=112525 RepID=A0AAD8FJU2_BIOPF|nr:guanine nucleotide-binding protein G(s) subunit alpha [Biomphalaria pfeifferi]
MACFDGCSPLGRKSYFESSSEARRARNRDKELTRSIKRDYRKDAKRVKLLLLGTGESGKSTMTKQMRIIHINGFSFMERMEKVKDIHKNILDSMLTLLSAMQTMSLPFEADDSAVSAEFILNVGADPKPELPEEFWDHCKKLWLDQGIQECFIKTSHYQLLDCAQYFLEKIDELRASEYTPSDQDILRCRVVTSSIQQIEFTVRDAGQNVRFCVYDVGGQRGERKKWIQVFDDVIAVMYVGEMSSFDQTLREDPTRNRLLESLENFEQVWNNRFLRPVSVLLFLNKIDILLEKVSRGRSIQEFLDQHPDMFPDYTTFAHSNADRNEFIESCPGGSEYQSKRRHRSSRTDISAEAVKTAAYIKKLYQMITCGELVINKNIQVHDKQWHTMHTCHLFYTCAVDTGNIKKVMEGCRSIIIRKHLERFGIL